MLSLQRARVQSLVWKLRSLKPNVMAKKTFLIKKNKLKKKQHVTLGSVVSGVFFSV